MKKFDRTLNAKRNLVYGFINKICNILLPFLTRTIIIYFLGLEYLGLNSLFTSLLTMLSLAELGLDSAIVCIMYEAVASEDERRISRLLNYIKKAYHIIGFVILCIGLLLLPFLTFLISDLDTVPKDINIYILYIIYLFNTSITYFFGGYSACVVDAYQRRDVISNISSIVLLLNSIVQVVILIVFRSYYLYIITLPIFSVVRNKIIEFQAKRLFPNIVPAGSVQKEDADRITKMVKGTFLSKIGGVLSVTVDNVVISAFLGLTLLACYSNYLYITNAIQGFLIVLYVSIQAGIGNSIVMETKEKNYEKMMSFSFVFMWVVGWCTYCLIYLFQPFINLWIGQQGVLPDIVVILICINFYLSIFDAILGVFKSAAGIWWEDRYRCLIGGMANLFMNIASVLYLKQFNEELALVGIVISTIVSQIFILTPWSTAVTFKYYFKTGLSKYVVSSIFYAMITLVNILISYPVMKIVSYYFSNSIVELLVRGVICIILPNIIYILVYKRNKYWNSGKDLFCKIVKKA